MNCQKDRKKKPKLLRKMSSLNYNMISEYSNESIKILLNTIKNNDMNNTISSTIILHNCIKEVKEFETFKELMYNGRHYKINITLVDTLLCIPPEIRTNIDYVFIDRTDDNTRLKFIHEHYAGTFPTYKSFNSIYNILTKKDNMMVIINRCGTSYNFSDKIKYYIPEYGLLRKKVSKVLFDKNSIKRKEILFSIRCELDKYKKGLNEMYRLLDSLDDKH